MDERSMVTNELVGAAERNTSQTSHGGGHQNEEWGGIPIMILIGDDYQLPPPTKKRRSR